MTDADVVIVGGGVAGASCAYHLQEAGVDDVVVLERDQPASKASGRAAGFLTPDQFLSAGTHVDAHAYLLDFWERMRVEEGLPLRYADAYTLARSEAGVADLERLHAETAVPSSLLSPAEIAERVPDLRVDGVEAAFAYPDGAFTDPHLATTTVMDAAVERGTDLRRERVVGFERDGDAVTGVVTEERAYAASTVVLAAGAWSKRLAAEADLAIPLKPRISQIAMLRPTDPVSLPLVNDPDMRLYYRTEPDGDVLVGGGTGTEELDPDDFSTDAREPFLQEVARKASQVSPGLADAALVGDWAGRCSATPDRHPLVGPASVDGLVYCCGFNGEGIIHAPVAGRLVADLVTDRASPFDRDPYDPGRFAGDVDDFAIKSATDW